MHPQSGTVFADEAVIHFPSSNREIVIDGPERKDAVIRTSTTISDLDEEVSIFGRQPD
jgi:hypothetical protein